MSEELKGKSLTIQCYLSRVLVELEDFKRIPIANQIIAAWIRNQLNDIKYQRGLFK